MGNYEYVRTDEEVDDLLNRIAEQVDRGGSRFPGMSYEEGVEAAVRWLLGWTDDGPYRRTDSSRAQRGGRCEA